MITQALLMKAAPYGFAFAIGIAVGQAWVTEQALTVQADTFSKQQAAVSEALIVKAHDDQKRVDTEFKQQMTAVDSALKVYEQGMEDAEAGRMIAERKLAAEFERTKQLAENIDDLKMVNKMLAEEFPVPEPSPGCILSVGVRQAINDFIARTNRRAAAGHPETATASLLDEPPRCRYPTYVPRYCRQYSGHHRARCELHGEG